MDIPLLSQVVCRGCDALLDSADNFCRHCGAATADGAPTPDVFRPRPPAPKQSLLDNPWLILGLLFLVMGPLALPMLWRGRAFGRRGKTVLTVLVVVLTVAIVWVIYNRVVLIINSLQDALII